VRQRIYHKLYEMKEFRSVSDDSIRHLITSSEEKNKKIKRTTTRPLCLLYKSNHESWFIAPVSTESGTPTDTEQCGPGVISAEKWYRVLGPARSEHLLVAVSTLMRRPRTNHRWYGSGHKFPRDFSNGGTTNYERVFSGRGVPTWSIPRLSMIDKYAYSH
jgi:hypothetical protein